MVRQNRIAILAAVCMVTAGGLRAQEFVDDFADGSYTDCSPLCWDGDGYDASEGDLRALGGGSLTMVGTFEGNVSVGARVNLAEAQESSSGFRSAAIWFGPPTGDLSRYMAPLGADGSYALDRWMRNGRTRLGEGSLGGFDVAADYRIQLETRGDFVEMRVWNAAGERPAQPTLRVEDTTYRSGNAGLTTGSMGAVFREYSASGTVVSPIVSLEVSAGNAPDEVCVDASGSTTVAGSQITGYKVNFGDGAVSEAAVGCHTYAPGVHEPSVLVTNDLGLSSRGHRQVTVGCPTENVNPWTLSSIGEPLVPPGARFPGPGESGEVILCGSGNATTTEETQPLLWQGHDGDLSLVVEITERPSGSTGITLRESLDADARHVALVLQGTIRFELLHRSVAGGEVVAVATSAPGHRWMRLVRQGDVFTGSVSRDGVEWTDVAQVTSEGFAASYLAGLTAYAVEPSDGSSFSVSPAHFGSISFGEAPEPPPPPSTGFHRGDCNGDGTVDLGDGVRMLVFTFSGIEIPGCIAACDFNRTGDFNISTAIYLFNFLFVGGPQPPAPFGACGDLSPSDEVLGCEIEVLCP